MKNSTRRSSTMRWGLRKSTYRTPTGCALPPRRGAASAATMLSMRKLALVDCEAVGSHTTHSSCSSARRTIVRLISSRSSDASARLCPRALITCIPPSGCCRRTMPRLAPSRSTTMSRHSSTAQSFSRATNARSTSRRIWRHMLSWVSASTAAGAGAEDDISASASRIRCPTERRRPTRTRRAGTGSS